jgi:hypothetical protein
MISWVKYVVPKVEVRNEYRVLVGKPEGKRPLRKPKCRWEDTIKIDVGDIA